MASHVVVLTTTFQRITVKVTPGKYISDVRDEVCEKLKLNSSNYGLKHNNKDVDLSRTFRQTGLSSGAKLELVLVSRTASVVSVALQLPESYAAEVPGCRIIDKVASTTTFWMILRMFETNGGRNLNFTGRGVAKTATGESGAGRVYYETPVLNVLGRELSSFADLQKSPAQLGLNKGSGLIRLTFRVTDQPLEDAMVEIGEHFKSLEGPQSTGSPTKEKSATEFAAPVTHDSATDTTMEYSATHTSSSSSEVAATHTPATPSEASIPEEFIVGPNQRPISVFAAPSGDTPKAALQSPNDSDYEPSIAHAKLHQARLQARSQNQRLLSDAEAQALAEEKAAKQATVKEVSIKVRFPDQLTVVSSFGIEDSGSTLYDFVRGVIVAEDQPFTLVWMGPKGPQTLPKDEKVQLIRDLGFRGRMLVNFNWEAGASDKARNAATLKGRFASQAKEIQVQEIAAAEAQEVQEAVEKKEKEKEQEKSAGGKGKGGVPKWLKLPGKK